MTARSSLYMLVSMSLIVITPTRAQTGSHALDHACGADAKPQVHYVKNLGQWPEQVRFKGLVNGAAVFLEEDGLTWVKYEEEVFAWMHDSHLRTDAERDAYRWAGHAWRMRFVNPAGPAMHTAGRSSTYHNYFIGNDEAKWAGGVPLFGEVSYIGIWPGVDLRLRGHGGNLKYDLLLAPGADPSVIALAYEGTDGIGVGHDGRLVIRTSVGELVEMAPVAFYSDARGGAVPCTFRVNGSTVGFHFPQGYDATRPLTIDPELIACTLSGAMIEVNYGHGATYDDTGNIYTMARSFGPGYPTTLGAFQMSMAGAGTDVALSKYNPEGAQLIYATYLGGATFSDIPHSMIVSAGGELCLLSSTNSTDFPLTSGCFSDSLAGGTDIAVTRFNASGTALIGSSLIGGEEGDGLNALISNYGDSYRGEIMLDAADNMVVASFSASPDFPTTPGAFQTVHGGEHDGVIFAMDPTCSTLLYSTFLGGSADDGAFGLRIAENGELLVVGQTESLDFPTTSSSHQPDFQGERDGFVMRLAPDASGMLASTYFGTANEDRAYFIDTDSNGDVWIYGQTAGSMPIQPPGTFGQPDGSGGLFLAKLSGALDSALITTKIGEVPTAPVPVAFALDLCDNVCISGFNSFFELPITPNSFYTSGSFYVASFFPDMTGQQFGTYYGGSHVDGGSSRFDKRGVIYQGVCSATGSLQTTPWAWATDQATIWDIGVFKIDLTENGLNTVSAEIPIAAIDGCSSVQVDFPNASNGNAWYWDFGDGSVVVEGFEASHAYTMPGTYTVQLTAVDSLTCNIADTDVLSVTVLAPPTAGTDATVEVCANAPAFLLADSLGGFPDAGGTWSLADEPHASVFVPAIDQNGAYCYTVTAAPCPADVACVLVSIIPPEDPRCLTLGVPEREASLSIWPNPGSGRFELSSNVSGRVSITDALGRSVWNANISAGRAVHVELPVHLRDGAYTVTVRPAMGAPRQHRFMLVR